MRPLRALAMPALAAVVSAASIGGLATAPAAGYVSPLTKPATIEKLAAGAYVWGLAPASVYRLSKYNALVTAPINTLGGGGAPAAWNNQGTNAGDASVLYLNGFLDLSGNKGDGGVPVPTTIRPMIRIYYPTPGSNTEASILPPPNGSMQATYVFPALQEVG